MTKGLSGQRFGRSRAYIAGMRDHTGCHKSENAWVGRESESEVHRLGRYLLRGMSSCARLVVIHSERETAVRIPEV